MTLIKFREWLFVITDYIYFLPLPFAFWYWKGLSKGQKYFALYFLFNFIFKAASVVVVLQFKLSNLYFEYFYSLIECILLYLMYQSFFEDTRQKKINRLLFLISFASFILDLFYITGFRNEENFLSQIIISIYIVGISLYFLSISVINNFQNKLSEELNLIISLSLLLKYFIKIIYAFLNKFIYETERNYFIAQQFDNYFNMITILTILMASWVFLRNFQQKRL